MDKTVYFSTLDQYKYNPAIIIEGSVDQSVLSAASGKVISIENVDETGTTITMDIGSGYQARRQIYESAPACGAGLL